MNSWANHAFFYHVYPLGLCGAPLHNFAESPIQSRLNTLTAWVPYLQTLGVNALYIGPLWESTSHGYDTINYHLLDRRLGHNADFQALVQQCHAANIRVVVDAVFNHVGRQSFAFTSLKQLEKKSPYKDWFENLRLGQRNARGDRFTYEGWKGHDDLVKLNLKNPEVQQFFFELVRYWINTFNIDGLRLDAADCMDLDFLQKLKTFCKNLKPDFWLMGEVVMGDYREWKLDAITNYELYDSLHKSHNEQDYLRLAQTLNRQFGPTGVYTNQGLFNFVDNHDVNRIASQLQTTAHLYPLHLLLFTLPGIPCLYYGSEVGLEGKRLRWSDRPLRPFFPHPKNLDEAPHQSLRQHIQQWSVLRQKYPVLITGSYQTLHVEKQLLCFSRSSETMKIIVMVNQSATSRTWLPSPQELQHGKWKDLLNEEIIEVNGITPLTIHSNWGRILLKK